MPSSLYVSIEGSQQASRHLRFGSRHAINPYHALEVSYLVVTVDHDGLSVLHVLPYNYGSVTHLVQLSSHSICIYDRISRLRVEVARVTSVHGLAIRSGQTTVVVEIRLSRGCSDWKERRERHMATIAWMRLLTSHA